MAWTKAPHCHHGLTVYNGNDFVFNKNGVAQEAFLDLKTMVKTAQGKCDTAHFICNDDPGEFSRQLIQPNYTILFASKMFMDYFLLPMA